eukprot:3122838-Rhodomonas_salina.1
MVTGDNLQTAKAIAKECGILTTGAAVEGPDFRKMTPEEQKKLLLTLQVLSSSSSSSLLAGPCGAVRGPATRTVGGAGLTLAAGVQVMARCSPTDKLILVRRLKEMGEVVAVTGDGTNDAPALKEADVGLSMGIAGTAVAQEASDIVIMDDNFSSIVKSVLWGRAVYDNIRRFLQCVLAPPLQRLRADLRLGGWASVVLVGWCARIRARNTHTHTHTRRSWNTALRIVALRACLAQAEGHWRAGLCRLRAACWRADTQPAQVPALRQRGSAGPDLDRVGVRVRDAAEARAAAVGQSGDGHAGSAGASHGSPDGRPPRPPPVRAPRQPGQRPHVAQHRRPIHVPAHL